MKRLPIGIENFKAMIDEGYYYVDKIIYIIFDYPYKHYTFNHFKV